MQRGSNLGGVRRYNERLALATIRRRNGASKTDIARASGLSPQAAVRIVDALEESGLVMRTGKRTGGMGQPSIIYEINGDGGFTVGVEIGRERIAIVLLNYRGEILDQQTRPVRFPMPDQVIAETAAFLDSHLTALPRCRCESFLGIGIAMPWFIGEWRSEIGISEDSAREWQRTDVEKLFRSRFDHPLFFENDGNAGAMAELLNGAGLDLESYLYLHIGTFIGGGLVMDGQLVEGRHGNAAAIASMPVPTAAGAATDFLIHRASLYSLERALGCSATNGHAFEDAISENFEVVANWVNKTSTALAFAIIGAHSLLDLQAIVIDGDLPKSLINEIISAVGTCLEREAPPDFFMPELLPGTMGQAAAAIGAGMLPMYATFSPNLSALLKSHER